MPQKIRIESDGNLLSRNEAMPVRVFVNFENATKVRGIHAEFYGAEKTEATYTVTTTDSKGKTKTETRTATEYTEIVNEQFLLLGEPRKGFFSRLSDSMATWVGGGSHEVVEPGEHEFALSLKLPHDALASFQGKKCEVSYRLTIRVDLPIKIDWSENQDFVVAPKPVEFKDTAPVHVVFPDASGRSFWDKTFGKDVKLNLAVDRDTLSIGEKALAMLTVESPEPLKVNKMEINLVGQETTKAQGHPDGHSHTFSLGKIDSPNVISSQSVHEFDILVPEIDAPHSQTGTNFQVNWTIEVRLSVPWAKDPVIRVPITLIPKPAIGQP